MKEVILQGKHISLKIYLKKALDLVFPFPVLLFIDGNLIAGTCWIRDDGNKKLYPIQGDPTGIIQEFLYCCDFLINSEELEGGGFIGNLREYAGKLGFPIKKNTKLYFTSLVIYMGEYIFELDGNTVNVHYNNIPLKDTNCTEFIGHWKGTVSIPLNDLVEDVLSLSKKYIEEIAPIETKMLVELGEKEEDIAAKLALLRKLRRRVEFSTI
ncbi:hypothetical protein [Thermococcus sp. 21S7]|uniref:hypothetical protein n=1 Tax=Thermococcus sp. 21S7 TaxID=1638221 RepID=UPI00143B911F|nr:hypothetical protein [Thermococcus sp. 21S7]NJE61193.1 hypothetical protein [Thermococcus sp. 21S7]